MESGVRLVNLAPSLHPTVLGMATPLPTSDLSVRVVVQRKFLVRRTLYLFRNVDLHDRVFSSYTAWFIVGLYFLLRVRTAMPTRNNDIGIMSLHPSVPLSQPHCIEKLNTSSISSYFFQHAV